MEGNNISSYNLFTKNMKKYKRQNTMCHCPKTQGANSVELNLLFLKILNVLQSTFSGCEVSGPRDVNRDATCRVSELREESSPKD